MLKFRWFKFSWLSNISSFYLWPKRFSGQTPHPGLLSIFQTLTCKGYTIFDICTFHIKNFGQKNYHANSIHNIFVEMNNLPAELFNSDFIHIQKTSSSTLDGQFFHQNIIFCIEIKWRKFSFPLRSFKHFDGVSETNTRYAPEYKTLAGLNFYSEIN